MIINVIAGIILFFSFIGGITRGVVKSFFALISLIIAIPLAGQYYPFFAGLLSFLPEENWENFLGFFVVTIIVNIGLSLIFYLPRKITEKVWPGAPY